VPDIFGQIEMPDFLPEYDSNKKYGYGNPRYKRNLKELLNKTSNDFCMYCYIRVAAEGKMWGHLEHSIEKINSGYLTECVPNIGWACPVCNEVFKKNQENERKILKKDIKIFEHNLNCMSNKCNKECIKYKNLKKKYVLQEEAHIILQPNGVKGFDTGLDLRLQYNVIKARFEPSEYQGEYSENEKAYIIDHINRFHLNDESYKTNALMAFFEDVIETGGHIVHTPTNNLVVKLFKDKLKGLEKEQIVQICNKLYIYYSVKLKEGNT